MNRETKKKIKTAGAVLFVLYILALIYFLFFADRFGRLISQKENITTTWCSSRKSEDSGHIESSWALWLTRDLVWEML